MSERVGAARLYTRATTPIARSTTASMIAWPRWRRVDRRTGRTREGVTTTLARSFGGARLGSSPGRRGVTDRARGLFHQALTILAIALGGARSFRIGGGLLGFRLGPLCRRLCRGLFFGRSGRLASVAFLDGARQELHALSRLELHASSGLGHLQRHAAVRPHLADDDGSARR